MVSIVSVTKFDLSSMIAVFETEFAGAYCRTGVDTAWIFWPAETVTAPLIDPLSDDCRPGGSVITEATGIPGLYC